MGEQFTSVTWSFNCLLGCCINISRLGNLVFSALTLYLTTHLKVPVQRSFHVNYRCCSLKVMRKKVDNGQLS